MGLRGQPMWFERTATRGARMGVLPPRWARMILMCGYKRFLRVVIRWEAALKVSLGT